VLLPVDSHLEIEAMCRTAISALLSLGRLAEDFREALSVRGIGRQMPRSLLPDDACSAGERVWVAVNQGQIEWSCSAVRIPSGGTMTSASSKRGGPNRTGALLLKPMASFGMPKKFRSTVKLSFSS